MLAEVLFVSFFLIFLAGNLAYFYMIDRLERTGQRATWLGWFSDHLKTQRQYTELRKSKGWPLWPLILVYASFAALPLLVVTLALDLSVLARLIG